MGCLWTFAETTELDGVLLIARSVGVLMLLVTVWEFAVNRNNKENIINFTQSFRKFRIREEVSGLKLADVLTLPDNLRRLFKWMLKQDSVAIAEVASFLKQDENTAGKMLEFLMKRGFVRETVSGGKTVYSIRLAPLKGSGVVIKLWEALGESAGKKPNTETT